MEVQSTGARSKPSGKAPSTARVSRGNRYEAFAARYLQVHRGYHLLKTHLRLGKFEVDLVFRKAEQTILVEVRGVSPSTRLKPRDGLTPRKKRAMFVAWTIYARHAPGPVRLEFLEIVGKLPKVKTWDPWIVRAPGLWGVQVFHTRLHQDEF